MGKAGKFTEKYSENKTKGTEVRILCPECKRIQTHVVVVSADLEVSEEYSEDFWLSAEDNFQVM